MAISPSVLAYEMRDAIYAAFEAEMHAGGKLANLVDLRKSNHLVTKSIVNASDVVGGISMRGWSEPEKYGQRTRKVVQKFEIVLAARAQATDTQIALLDNALAVLRPVIDDGAGGGIIGVLNNPATFGLGMGVESELGAGRFEEFVQAEGADQSIWAYFTVDYDAVGYYSF